jgi:LasA protease
MKKLLIVIPIIALVLSACGQAPPLWGAYQTPTPVGYASHNAMQAEMPILVPSPTLLPTMTPPPASTATIPPSETPVRTTFLEDGTPALPTLEGASRFYYSQSGDSLKAVASHFDVAIDEISANGELPDENSLLNPGTLLIIPDLLKDTTPNTQIFPDSEIVLSATSIDFDPITYVEEAGGYLVEHRDYLGSTGWTSGAESVRRHAFENSFNPRLLLALIEYESGWLFGDPGNISETDYPLGYIDVSKRGLFRQMMIAVQDLALGYYGWREGSLTELTFTDGTTKRIAPDLNAGSVAIQYYFAQKLPYDRWAQTVDKNVGFPALYAELFGDPWVRARSIEPLFPAGLTQPALTLPFDPGKVWAYTGGPHSAWEHEGALAAIDFAPSSDVSGCTESDKWVIAPVAGLVVRSDKGVIVLDLDGDGNEATGWNLLFLHKPSCEGGISTGTHLHFARKYNGEWMLADGPIPFDLDGWITHAGEKPYKGTLTRGDEIVTASQVGEKWSVVVRERSKEE